MISAFAPALLAMSMLASALPSSLPGNLTIYGPDTLSSQVSSTFLSCLKQTGVDYKLYVDQGTTVAFPPTNRTIDFDSEDEKLFECIAQVNHQMDIAAESTLFHTGEFRNATLHRHASHEWLSAQGALGKKPMGSAPHTGASNSNQTLDRRVSSLLYWSYPASDNYCTHYDAQHSYPGACHTANQAYSSIKFENPDDRDYLNVLIYPHHRCEKGNSRSVLTSPRSYSKCQERRTTYSWRGSFKRCGVC